MQVPADAVAVDMLESAKRVGRDLGRCREAVLGVEVVQGEEEKVSCRPFYIRASLLPVQMVSRYHRFTSNGQRRHPTQRQHLPKCPATIEHASAMIPKQARANNRQLVNIIGTSLRMRPDWIRPVARTSVQAPSRLVKETDVDVSNRTYSRNGATEEEVQGA